METNTTGASNVAVGNNALLANTTASNNTAVGTSALAANNSGVGENTALGAQSASSVTSGSYNTVLGYRAGIHTVTLTTGDSNTLVGSYSRTTTVDSLAANVFGHDVGGGAGYTTVGYGAADIRAAHGVATWATVSDERYKKDIVDSTTGLSFINALRPRTFKYRTLGELPETFSAYKAGSTEVFKNSETNHGFIAQEVKAAIDADDSIKDGFKLWDDREDGSQEVAEAALIPVLVKAIQELSTQLDAALARITTLEGA
jgi:trimeric autotransporter adhesin